MARDADGSSGLTPCRVAVWSGRDLLGVLGRLVEGRTSVRLEREQRATLQTMFREAPAGTVVGDQSAADWHLTVHLPQISPMRVYCAPEPVSAPWHAGAE